MSFRTLQSPGFTPTSSYTDVLKVYRWERPVFPQASFPPLSTFVSPAITVVGHYLSKGRRTNYGFSATLWEETRKEINWNVGCSMRLPVNALKSTLHWRKPTPNETRSDNFTCIACNVPQSSLLFKSAVGCKIITYRNLLIYKYTFVYVNLKLPLLIFYADL